MDPEPDSLPAYPPPETLRAVSRSDADRILDVLVKMPERRRTIFLAARRHRLSNAAIAKRAGLAVPDVEREIAAALLDVDAALQQRARHSKWRRVLALLHRLAGG